MKTARPLMWDVKAERFVNDDAANAMLSRPERGPCGAATIKLAVSYTNPAAGQADLAESRELRISAPTADDSYTIDWRALHRGEGRRAARPHTDAR